MRKVVPGALVVCSLLWGCAHSAAQVQKGAATVTSHGSRSSNAVALTFDVCSTRRASQYDGRITRELIAAQAPATIFVGGSWAHDDPQHLKELADNPLFELGNHSYSHPHMTRVSAQRVRNELKATQAEILSVTGREPALFRPPYGEYNGKLVREAASLGLTTIGFDLASGDPDRHATRARLVDWVLKQARPGSIIVMHINHTRFHTAEALPEIIDGLRDRGLTLVKVSDLLALADTRGRR